MSAALEAARSYVARGWNPLPLPFKSKIPVDDGWPLRVIREHDLPRFFHGKPQNVGVVLGPSSNGLTDVDLDCREAIELASHVLQKTGAVFGRKSAPASHRLYRSSLASTLGKATISFRDPTRSAGEITLLEVRVGGEKGAQTVFPGSVHESDEKICWDEPGEPAEISDNDLMKQVRLLASTCLLARYWPGEGARHDAALSVGGFLTRAGLPAPQIKYLVEAIARTAGDTEARNRLEAARDAAQAFHDGKNTYGFPSLKRTFGEAVAKQVADWLEYSGSRTDDMMGPAPVDPVEPVDLWAKFEPPPLPRGLLPQLLEDFTFERSAVMGCDPTGLALGALVVCAASIPEDIQIQPKRNDTLWLESARIWVGLIGGVSEMKSPILDTVAAQIRDIDNEMERAYQEALGRWLALPKKVREITPRPKHLRAKIMNTTVESAQEILKDSPDGVLLEQDELSGWFGSMDKYTGSRGAQADRAFWLQTFNGKPYTVDRIGRGSIYIPHLSVSILGFIQPEPIRKLADGGEDDGLLQRFIPGILRPAVKGDDVAPEQPLFDYETLVESLRKLRPPRSGILYPPDAPLTFDDGALKIREELDDKHRELSQCKTINRKLTSHIGKYNGIFARLCLIWHCIEHVYDPELPTVITEDTARRVADFLHGFLFPHALAFYAGVLGLANDHDVMADVAGYILARGLKKVTSRDIQRGTQGMRRLAKLGRRETEGLLEQMEAFGWVMRAPGPRPSDPPHWIVNPVVHQKFEALAKMEKERRAREVEMIKRMLKKRKTVDEEEN